MIVKKKSDLLVNILLIPYLLYLFFYDLTDQIGGPVLSYSLIIIPIMLIFPAHYLNIRGTFSQSIAKVFSGWLILLLFVFCNNKAFLRGTYFDSFRLAAVIYFTFILAHFNGWLRFALKAMIVLGMVHVAATIVFYFSNDLYRLLILPLRELPPLGSVQGTEGYHSGLCSHYSLNGTYCAVLALIFGTVYLKSCRPEANVYTTQIHGFSRVHTLVYCGSSFDETGTHAFCDFFIINCLLLYEPESQFKQINSDRRYFYDRSYNCLYINLY